jgi:hypothetical protein
MDHPSASTDLVSVDFWLFQELKECAGRKAFLGLEEENDRYSCLGF